MDKENTQPNFKNITPVREESSPSVNSLTFFDYNGLPPIKSYSMTPSSSSYELYDIIKSQAPIGMWKLKKITKFSYSFIKKKVREFEFVKLVYCINRTNKDNRIEKIIYVPSQDKPLEDKQNA
jgi:hypothetical protein